MDRYGLKVFSTDSLDLLESERGLADVDKTFILTGRSKKKYLNWNEKLELYCNSPTATIANIVGVSASIEPTYQNIYVKSNLFRITIINKYLK